MKKSVLLFASCILYLVGTSQNNAATPQLLSVVSKLDRASTVKEFESLANDFENIAKIEKDDWLPYYYAAFCNAKAAWLKENSDPESIEQNANLADKEIKLSASLLDTSEQKKELSEVYCILSMVNRARVFINPVTYGRQYGPLASHYTILALNANSHNPRAIYLEGWEKYVTPKMWGGDKSKGRELLESAKKILDENPLTGIEPHWGKTEIEATLQKQN